MSTSTTISDFVEARGRRSLWAEEPRIPVVASRRILRFDVGGSR
ncbi:hypothetical protein [Frondihabitans sp. VKM Ac-2883]|nr:hypothetical protein [Frondihabitans sp. VKM Ac-2883]